MQFTVKMQDDGLEKIRKLNLERFYSKLIKEQPHKNWSPELFNTAKEEYRRFLELEYRYPDLNFGPTCIMDDLWHQHILDTKAYTRDCAEILGKYLHHAPSFDDSESEKDERMIEARGNLVEKYSMHFGGSPYGLQGPCTSGCAGTCGDCSDCDDDG
tara:strand:+ start:153 stop:623 length:471 start_codon:yes stop_codon:yes gene_type:complete